MLFTKVDAVPSSDVWDDDGELDFISVGAVAEKVSLAAIEERGPTQSRKTQLRSMHHSGKMRVALHAVKHFLEREKWTTVAGCASCCLGCRG